MARQTPAEKTERLIATILAKRKSTLTAIELERRLKQPIDSLTAFPGLRDLPREKFKDRLRRNLERRATMASSPQSVKYIREGFRSVTPYLIIPRAADWIDQVKRAFGAEERFLEVRS